MEIQKRAASELRGVIGEALGPGGISSKVEKEDFEGAQKDCVSVIDLMLSPPLCESFPKDDPFTPTDAYRDFLKGLRAIASSKAGREHTILAYRCLQDFHKLVFKPAQGK